MRGLTECGNRASLSEQLQSEVQERRSGSIF